MDVIEKALKTAAKAHEKQYRKGTDIPYVTHPIAVGMILIKAGYSDELVAAGILHDTVEDTDLSLQDIEQLFGKSIADIVEGCSEPDKSLTWEERKADTIEYLKTAPEKIRVVACADKLHNIQSIASDIEQFGDQVWEKFNRGKEKQKWYYTSVIESLDYQSSFPLLDKLKVSVKRLFKSNYEE
ncbi:(p)ppGpp synthase/HD superfamily hydrolase [Bacillus sp. SORGH_AS 510]|uniref:HD domain-containing protein n=1 Tax=Bacillus sp. SORGH_AS_0510 TaxID=3041771 RepID=UPI00278527AB|nr:HD domain-containing protein [Bacillus sp. SORGH_AS_0510]MDQ1147656.1 (p)ppGpp synthase/HD superfamily hydrolase [Bacillus sp. SORGH_AS_0510]